MINWTLSIVLGFSNIYISENGCFHYQLSWGRGDVFLSRGCLVLRGTTELEAFLLVPDDRNRSSFRNVVFEKPKTVYNVQNNILSYEVIFGKI
jgi:hypothetical protein